MTADDVDVGPLEFSEIDELIALAGRIWRAHYPAIISTAQIEYMLAQRYTPDVLRADLERDDLWWDRVRLNGCMAAFASYFQAADAMKLDKLYVDPRLQRQGFGQCLLERAVAKARGRHCKRITLAVNKRNAQAIAAYGKHGFKIVESVIKDIGGGFVMDDYVMSRDV
jgi:diamine N-acetyltransferase